MGANFARNTIAVVKFGANTGKSCCDKMNLALPSRAGNYGGYEPHAR